MTSPIIIPLKNQVSYGDHLAFGLIRGGVECNVSERGLIVPCV